MVWKQTVVVYSWALFCHLPLVTKSLKRPGQHSQCLSHGPYGSLLLEHQFGIIVIVLNIEARTFRM
jgi:hypothetical protein